MKITALPFITGAWISSYFTGDVVFAVSATLILGLLVITKQINLL